jgi:drug/metabolite transporter (DMT)-like permease
MLASSSGLFIRLIPWHPFIIAGGRSAIAAVFMISLRLFMRSKKRAAFRLEGAKAAFPAVLDILKNVPVWLTAVSYCGTMAFFVTANKYTSSANVIVLQYSAPVWSALFSAWLLREKPKAGCWASLCLIFAGLYIMLKDGLASGSLFGDALALLSGLFFGASPVFMRMQKKGSAQDGVITAHFLTAAAGAVFVLFYPPQADIKAVSAVLFLGVFQLGVSGVLFAYGVKRTDAVTVMLISALEPIFNPLWVFLASGEVPAASAFAGGALILAAVFIANIPAKAVKRTR